MATSSVQHIVLKDISIRSLKGIKDCSISIDGPLTAIMGINGIGKSTILHALACSFRSENGNGEERKFFSFFPPNTNSTWKDSRFTITYSVVDGQGNTIRNGFTEYQKTSDRWTPRYDRQQKKNTFYLGIDTCTPDIELVKDKKVSYVTTNRDDKTAKKIIEKASLILNKDYRLLTNNKTARKSFIGVITGNDIKYTSLSMGAGEQRVFRILDVISKAPIYSLILIDEIDLLLHPEALKKLIKEIYESADNKHLQVVFTTHSLIMNDVKQFVKIKYLDWHEEKVDVYDGIASLGWRMLSGDNKKPIHVFVEDELSSTIVKKIARELNALHKIKVGMFGAAENAFTLAASMIIREDNIDNTLIVLDGDIYRTDDEKRQQIKKHYSGTEESADEKRKQAISIISQYALPEDKNPEQFLHGVLCDMDDEDEIISIAKSIHAVKDNHEWIAKIAQEIDYSSETIISAIIDKCSKSDKWEGYVQPVKQWIEQRKNL